MTTATISFQRSLVTIFHSTQTGCKTDIWFSIPHFSARYWRVKGIQGYWVSFWIRRSRHRIIKPPATIKKTPGMSLSNGASSKNNQPKMKENGMPKYSKGERLLGCVRRYAAIIVNTAVPPTDPRSISQPQWKIVGGGTYSVIPNIKASVQMSATIEV